ncbi:uncharacterized protein rab44 isoform X2 [Pseudoliparis swirei]|uniref:uncharacterized protein rab44 isoform X2 n=1 Tax=Pseudoliparis swirei TaxID=2059687 RepID=UPI0024BED16C|nr:uncharacterized protein rab44 isoform X2 [Pseudoliparis swirei]
MSASANKKRLGSRRRAAEQNEMSKTDDLHSTASTFAAQPHMQEEHTAAINVLDHFENSHSETQHPLSPKLLGIRRKLGSRRRNKEERVRDSVTESDQEPREEVEHMAWGHPLQPEMQPDASPDYSSEVQDAATTNCSEADGESFSSKRENLPIDPEVISESCTLVNTVQEGIDKSDLYSEEVKEIAHIVGISELTSLSGIFCPIVDQQLIDRSNCTEMPEGKLPNVCSVTENEGKERDDNTELFFSTTPERTTQHTELECSVWKETISSPKDELPAKVKQNEHLNVSEVVDAHSEDAVNKVHDNEIKLMDMQDMSYSSESRMHDATDNSEISGNPMNQTGVCETNQSELIVKSIHDSPTNQEVSIPDRLQEENVEALEWNNEDYRGYDTNEDFHSEVAINKLHEQDVEPKENQEMPQLDYSLENVIQNPTESSVIISGNLMNQTEVSDTYQYTLTVTNPDDFPTNWDHSNPDNIQDEHPTEGNHVEASEQKNKDVHVYESKEPQISDMERVDTALSQVFEMEGRVEDDTKPSAKQTCQQGQEGLLSGIEESASSSQTLQSEINVPFDSQPQQNDTSFNSIGNRRKLGSSRRNKRRQHVEDSVAESDHEPTEDVVGNISDNETLETTEMTITAETAAQEKSIETLQQGTDTFDTAQTEDVSGQIKENTQDGSLVGIDNLNSSGLQSSSTLDQQTIEQFIFREMPDEAVPNEFSVTEKENEERNKDTDRFRQDGKLKGKNVVIESHVKSEDLESSITLERGTEKSSPEEPNEIKSSVEQAELSSSEEKLRNINKEQKEQVNLSQIRGTWHSQDVVNKVHEEEIKPTDMEEMHQMDNLSIDSESNLQKLQSESNAPLDSQPLEHFQNIKEQTYKGFKPTGNRTQLGSSQRNGQLHVTDATKMSLVIETMRQEEIKECTDLNSKSAGEMRTNRLTVNDKENTEKMSEEDTMLSQNVCNKTNVTTDITSSSGEDGSNKEVTEEENLIIKETEDVGQLAGCDTVQMDLIQSQEVSFLKNKSDIQSSSYHYDVTAKSHTSDEAFHVQNTEASHFDKETITQQTNETSGTVGNVTIKDFKTGAESTMYVRAYEQDEDGAQLEDPTKKENEAQEIPVSKERFSAPHNTTDTSATFDISFKDENLRAEPAVDVSEESGISSQQEIQEKSNLDDSENVHIRSKQKRRKMGSTRRSQLNSKPEEKRVETEQSDREAVKMGVVEELTMIATAEVSQNENAKPSLSLVYKEQMESTETSTVDGMGEKLQSSDLQSNMMSDIDHSKALPPEQSGSHNEDIADPVKLVHAADVSDRERNVDVSVEPSQIDERHITSAFAGRNPINQLMSANTKVTTDTSISGEGFVSFCETTQSTQHDEERPENVNVLLDQDLKSTEALVLVDLEEVQSVVKGGAGEEHITAGESIQEPDIANEGAHDKNLEMKNASSYLDTSSRRRKMGSTRRNLRTGSKQEDLHQKQDVNHEATETATDVGDVGTESFSNIVNDELQLDGKHKDIGSETIEYSHTGESHKLLAHQTSEENPVSQGQILEPEHQLTPSYLPSTPSTSPKHDLISESASGGRRRKMGSHRKSHGHQDNDNQTARRDRITDTQHERDVRSIGEESAIKTEELREECLGLLKISKVDESLNKPFSNLSTSKEGEHSRPVSERTPEPVTPLRHHYAESQQKLSLASRADLRSNAYNVMMVGDSSVGKTSFMRRAQSGKFSLDIPPSIGLDSCMWTVIVEGKPVVLQLWDTAGQERFHSITRQTFHKAHAFLLMYDVTSSQSFSAVSYWASCIQEGAAESVTILLVGNKSDRAERQVQTQEAEILAKFYFHRNTTLNSWSAVLPPGKM